MIANAVFIKMRHNLEKKIRNLSIGNQTIKNKVIKHRHQTKSSAVRLDNRLPSIGSKYKNYTYEN